MNKKYPCLTRLRVEDAPCRAWYFVQHLQAAQVPTRSRAAHTQQHDESAWTSRAALAHGDYIRTVVSLRQQRYSQDVKCARHSSRPGREQHPLLTVQIHKTWEWSSPCFCRFVVTK